MALQTRPAQPEPTRDEIDALAGATLLEFGTSWCGHCRAAQPLIASAFAAHPDVRHVKVEDGSGRRLGRSFGVKLWPTLVFLRDGVEVARAVRPRDVATIEAGLAGIDGGAGDGTASP
jgi:thioredoxin 1